MKSKVHQDVAEYEHGTLAIDPGEPTLYPLAPSVFVDTEKHGDLLHGVAAMDFNQAVVGMTPFHCLPKH
jgi:hypothetical protein